MSFKMKSGLCMLALTAAFYAQAQERAATAQNQPAASQAGKAQSNEDRNRSSDAQNRKDNKDNTGQDRNRKDNANEDRNRNRDVNVQRTETTERAGSSSGKPLDTALANCLLLGNQKEVTISQFAVDRAKHEKVKEFARQMVKDHGQAITMLQRFAGPDASKDLGSSSEATRVNRSETVNRSTTTVEPNRSPEGEQRDANRNRDDASNRNPNDATNRTRSETTVQIRSEHEALPDKMLAIEREVAQKCIAMAKQELEQSSNFDQAYVGMQISAHVGMIAKLETFKSYASPDLGKVIQESLETAQGHLRHAKELVTEISHSDASRRSDASPRSETSKSDTNVRNPANRDNDSSRREGTPNKKDAPKN
jgi:predicted outer membrane protein